MLGRSEGEKMEYVLTIYVDNLMFLGGTVMGRARVKSVWAE